ncbi:hypothetical protein GLOIN_2v1502041 [Rhizophagus irregularis DAOM 181602=DAOM 197198]|nr:hypothetical protein GLOIN_2v1502041 [Rhizophagus irregularis DAOM 181602=DAOM 197198]
MAQPPISSNLREIPKIRTRLCNCEYDYRLTSYILITTNIEYFINEYRTSVSLSGRIGPSPCEEQDIKRVGVCMGAKFSHYGPVFRKARCLPLKMIFISLNFRFLNAENKNIIFAIEISKDKQVFELENEVSNVTPDDEIFVSCKIAIFIMYYCPLPAIGTIRQFPPATYRLEDDEEELVQCIKEIKCRLGNIGTMLADNNEAMRCDTEGKLHQVVMGFAQNLIQCESALQVNKNMRNESRAKHLGMTTTISMGSLQQPRNVCLERGFGGRKGVHKNVKQV